MYKLVIPGRLPGLNEILKATGSHWSQGYRQKQGEMDRVMWLAKAAKIPAIVGKSEITIACYEPNAKRDPNNVQAGADKIILDALQNVGVLKGDGRKYINLIPVPVEVDRENPRIEVIITELAAEIPEVKRGEIYYFEIPSFTGHEMGKNRPGIVVSCDALNDTSPCVQAVFLTSVDKNPLPEHVPIRSARKPSIALCEHLYTVDKSRLRDFQGICTAKEMEKIEDGIAISLGMKEWRGAGEGGQE